MARMLVTDRDGGLHEVQGQLGVKLMETLREFDYGVTAICGGLCSCATCHGILKSASYAAGHDSNPGVHRNHSYHHQRTNEELRREHRHIRAAMRDKSLQMMQQGYETGEAFEHT